MSHCVCMTVLFPLIICGFYFTLIMPSMSRDVQFCGQPLCTLYSDHVTSQDIIHKHGKQHDKQKSQLSLVIVTNKVRHAVWHVRTQVNRPGFWCWHVYMYLSWSAKSGTKQAMNCTFCQVQNFHSKHSRELYSSNLINILC